jgi:hypothetical protein
MEHYLQLSDNDEKTKDVVLIGKRKQKWNRGKMVK